MRTRKPGLPIERHRRIGTELKTMRDSLVKLAVEIGNAYPVTSRQTKAAEKAWIAIDDLRARLDDAAFREHPEVASPGVYYPRTPAPEPKQAKIAWWAK
jgi:hypothetical protein